MRDLYSNDVQTAAYLARETDAYDDTRPGFDEIDPTWDLTEDELDDIQRCAACSFYSDTVLAGLCFACRQPVATVERGAG